MATLLAALAALALGLAKATDPRPGTVPTEDRQLGRRVGGLIENIILYLIKTFELKTKLELESIYMSQRIDV